MDCSLAIEREGILFLQDSRVDGHDNEECQSHSLFSTCPLGNREATEKQLGNSKEESVLIGSYVAIVPL